MKKFLALSMVLNAALAITLAWAFHRPAAENSGNSTVASATNTPRKELQAEAAASAEGVQPTATPQLFDWRLVESDDYKKYIANLRSVGCPEETIRDIITADVNKMFENRRREMNASTNKFKFWKAGNVFGDMVDPAQLEKNQELAKEKRALLKELLGVEPEEKPDLFAGINPFETMLDFLPSTKQNQVMEVYTKFQSKMMKELGSGQPDAEDMKKMQKAQKDMEAELASIMTPQEFDDYQLRMSQTAMMMRSQLASFDPNEQEFRDIFKVKKVFDDDYSNMYGMSNSTDKEEKAKRQAAEKEMNDQIKATLGDSRYAEYQRSQDYNYQSIYRVTEKYGLSKDTSVKVYDMKQAAEDEAKKVRNDKTLTKEQRQTALAGIRSETEKSMQGALGDKGWNSYQGQAYWLQSISPKKDQ